MFKQTVFVLISFLAIASAQFNPTFEEGFFVIPPQSSFSYTLFQTRRGIIAHDLNKTDEQAPQNLYLFIDLPSNNVTVILSDILVACEGQNASQIDRLNYHLGTETLLYYCASNNSLLIIDEDDYTVQSSIPTNIMTSFDEVKLIPQAYSIAILGMSNLLSQSPSPSELVTINLQDKVVVNHIVFNSGLSSGEAVVGYAVSGKGLLYVMTNQYLDYTTSIERVYSMFSIGNSYTLNNLAIVGNNFGIVGSPTISNLYCMEELIITTNGQDLVIMGSQGETLGTVQYLATKFMFRTGLPSQTLMHVALAVDYQTSQFYALLVNGTVIQFSAEKGGYSSDIIANNVTDMQYITSNLSANSLMFTTDTFLMFNITIPQTGQVISSVFHEYSNTMITDTTFSFYDADILYIYDRKTRLLLNQVHIDIGYYFYEQKTHIVSFITETNNTPTANCQIVQVNLQTGNVYIPYIFNSSYSSYDSCANFMLVDVANDQDEPQFIMKTFFTGGDPYLIVSKNFDPVLFNAPSLLDPIEAIIVDYDTLTLYYVQSLRPGTKLWVYDYNTTSQSLVNRTQITDMNLSAQEFDPAGGQFSAFANGELGIIDLESLNITTYPFSSDWNSLSSFQDESGAVYTILWRYSLTPYYPGIFYLNQLYQQLPESTEFTMEAGAAGLCSYFIQDALGDVTLTKYYNICKQNESSKIYV